MSYNLHNPHQAGFLLKGAICHKQGGIMFSSQKAAENQEKMLQKLDALQSDFRLIGVDVAGIKKALEDHKKDTDSNLSVHERKIDKVCSDVLTLSSEQTAAKASIATIKLLGSGVTSFILLIGGWYLNNINTNVKIAYETASTNAQKITQVQQTQDERKARIATLEDRVSVIREEMASYKKGRANE